MVAGDLWGWGRAVDVAGTRLKRLFLSKFTRYTNQVFTKSIVRMFVTMLTYFEVEFLSHRLKVMFLTIDKICKLIHFQRA